MFRRVIAGLILGPALLIGSVAWSGYLALQTIFDEDRSATIAQELLDNEQVKAQLAANLGTAIEGALPDAVPLSAEQVDAASLAVLNDPRVTDLVVGALGQTHRSFLGLNDVPQTLDLNPLAEVAREQIGTISTDAAAAIPADTNWTIDLPTERIPNSSPVKDFLETAVPYLAAIAVVMALIALLTTSDRPSVLRRAAFWAMGTTAFYLILGFGIPALLRVVIPDQAEIFAALLTAVLRSTLTPSIVLAAVGGALLIGSWIWPDERRQPQPRRVRQQPTPQPHAQPVVYQRPAPQPAPSAYAPPPTAQPTPSPAAPPPTTHIAPARPQAAAPPHQPVTPPSTPVVPATPPSNPAVPSDATVAHDPAALDPFAPPPNAPRPAPTDDDFPPPIITGADIHASPAAPNEPPPFRPTLPTRASPSEPVSLPAWTGDLSPSPDATPTGGVPKARPPRWVDGHGWVLDPDDDRPVPPNARYVEGVGYVVPGPPPRH
ncbi:MAG: hypothetical protein AAGA37_00585 [Actinomycetota bacterium]